jgi:hypothetical protein
VAFFPNSSLLELLVLFGNYHRNEDLFKIGLRLCYRSHKRINNLYRNEDLFKIGLRIRFHFQIHFSIIQSLFTIDFNCFENIFEKSF